MGSNLGNREQYLSDALALLEEKVGTITNKTTVHTTEAWGNTNQPDFLNMALEIESALKPLEVLTQTQAIEAQLGRQRIEKWGARTLDIDILYCEDLILNDERLIIPHPYLHQRKFTLDLLVELDADFIHPVLKKNHSQLLAEVE